MDLTQSPVPFQDFIWVAEYYDDTVFMEYDYVTKQSNNFYSIDKNKLIRFGISGYGMRMYYEVLGGTFKIAGKMIEIIYKLNGRDYYLTGHPLIMYNDIIQYKRAESILDVTSGKNSETNITEFSFGYKQQLTIDGINFIFKPICKIPYGGKVYLSIWLVADQELNGILEIRKNGITVAEIEAPLEPGVGGMIDWTVGN